MNVLKHKRVRWADGFTFHNFVCTADCCSVLQCVAVCCSLLQCAGTPHIALQLRAHSAATPSCEQSDQVRQTDAVCSVLQCVAVCCNVCCNVCCSVLQRDQVKLDTHTQTPFAVCCSALQCFAVSSMCVVTCVAVCVAVCCSVLHTDACLL